MPKADNKRSPNSPDASGLDIRRVTTWPEYRACVELQREVWGGDFSDQVPASILSVAQRIGGVTAGAFEADGRLVGFVFGISGIREGRLVHWSDLMAVRADARDRGVGRQLKLFQRELVRADGATTMYWSFDPLVARNAHFNFTTLGVKAVEYVEDMYGADTGSILHRGLGTDRLIAAWAMEGAGALASESEGSGRADDLIPLSEIVVLNPTGTPPRAVTPPALPPLPAPTVAPCVGVVIPLDIHGVQRATPEEAVRWRAATRSAFQWAFANGYHIGSFRRLDATGSGLYVLLHQSAAQLARNRS
jgi:chorismate synthase